MLSLKTGRGKQSVVVNNAPCTDWRLSRCWWRGFTWNFNGKVPFKEHSLVRKKILVDFNLPLSIAQQSFLLPCHFRFGWNVEFEESERSVFPDERKEQRDLFFTDGRWHPCRVSPHPLANGKRTKAWTATTEETLTMPQNDRLRVDIDETEHQMAVKNESQRGTTTVFRIDILKNIVAKHRRQVL